MNKHLYSNWNIGYPNNDTHTLSKFEMIRILKRREKSIRVTWIILVLTRGFLLGWNVMHTSILKEAHMDHIGADIQLMLFGIVISMFINDFQSSLLSFFGFLEEIWATLLIKQSSNVLYYHLWLNLEDSTFVFVRALITIVMYLMITKTRLANINSA
ncbi:hypothetical protein SCA6_002261 [Theobroma cacao]